MDPRIEYEFERLTAENDHTGAAQVLADAVVKELAQIAKRQMDIGYITKQDQIRRDNIAAALLELLK